jgi:predicted ATP-grasp superfamily ATP-dependent carboligase
VTGIAAQRILVTDGEQRAALASIRSLGAAGHQVTVVSSRTPCIGSVSRYAAKQAVLPSPMRNGAAFAAAIWARAAADGCGWILPITEESVLALDPATAPPGAAKLLAPPLEVFRRLSDKELVLATAAQQGIRVPRQWVITRPNEPLPQELPARIAIKAARSIVGEGGNRQRNNVQYAEGREAVAAALAQLPAEAFPVLVQERIRGQGIGAFLLRWDGRTVARFAHRRMREKPPTGGVSVCAQSVALDPALAAASEKLVSALGLEHGVAMVEYKQDASTGEPVLMEINGRLWGSLQLAIDSGVDFPSLWLACANNAAPAVPPTWRQGQRLRWRWGEIDHLVARLRRRYDPDDLPPNDPGLLRTIVDVLRPLATDERSELARRDDPAPSRRETLDWLQRR